MFKFCGLITNDAADLQKRVEQFKRDSEKVVQGPEEDFGQRLKEATERRRSGSHAVAATSRTAATSQTFVSAEESFGEKLKRAVEKLPSSPKQTKERAEKERSRYRQPQRRERTSASVRSIGSL